MTISEAHAYRNLNKLPFMPDAHTVNLRRLCAIRIIVLALLCLAAWYGYSRLNISNHAASVSVLLAMYLVLILATAFHLQSSTDANNDANNNANNNEFTVHLVTEIGFIAIFVYFTGGATNPFVYYFLIPISIASAALSTARIVCIAGLAIVAYTVLLFNYQPLSLFAHHTFQAEQTSTAVDTAVEDITVRALEFHFDNTDHDHRTGHQSSAAAANSSDKLAAFNPHYFGMWLNFVVSALLISWLVSRMATGIRQQEQTINHQREQQLLNEQIMGIATMAAGTAHELGTPLNTLKLLVNELQASLDKQTATLFDEELGLMKKQIEQCHASLKKLASTAEHSQPGQEKRVDVGHWLKQVVDHWQPLRPEIICRQQFEPEACSGKILQDETLNQAVTNLLNNAANTGTDSLEIDIELRETDVDIVIRDHGPGISETMLNMLGSRILTGELTGQGLGVGVFLSNASINRLGGELILSNQLSEQHQILGAEVRIRLPVDRGSHNALSSPDADSI